MKMRITYMMDTSREIRAMMMASFPCPPLPLDNGGNSHDLVSFLADVAARRNINKENETREKEQTKLTEAYFNDLETSGDLEQTWNAMTNFTRRYMMTYAPNLHAVRFAEPECVTIPHKQQVCSWLAAQHILHGDHQCTGKYFENLSPRQIYKLCKEVLVYKQPE